MAKVLPAVLAATAPRFDALAMVKPQFEVGRERLGKGGVVREAADRRAALVAVAGAARAAGAAVLGFASSGLPGPKGNRETFLWLAEAGARRRARRRRRRGGRAGGRAVRSVTVLSHARTEDTGPALRMLVDLACEHGVVLRLDPEETRKHRPEPRPCLELDAELTDDVELCVALGGDGTILRALRRYAGTGVPVFAVNYGEVGFLATIDPDGEATHDGLARALEGDFETLTLPAIALRTPAGPQAAINDLAIHRKVGERVAQLAYLIEGEEVGSRALRRARGLDAGRVDRLQPRQRRPGDGLGRRGLRRVLHRPALAHRPRARRRAERRARRSRTGRTARSTSSSTGGRSGSSARGRPSRRASCARPRTWPTCPGSSFYRRLREKFGRLAS